MYSVKASPHNRGAIITLTGSLNKARSGLRKGWFELGRILKKTAQDGIKKGPKTGRYYIYKGRRKRASSPGQYPANRSGRTRRGVDFKIQGEEKMSFVMKEPWSKFLEKGTKFMKKRPVLEQSHNTNKHKIEPLVGNIVLKELIR